MSHTYNRPPLRCRVGVSRSRKYQGVGTVGAGNDSALVPFGCRGNWQPLDQADTQRHESQGLTTSVRGPSGAFPNPYPVLGLSWLWASEFSTFTCQSMHLAQRDKTSPMCAWRPQALLLSISQPFLAEAMDRDFKATPYLGMVRSHL